MIKVGLTGGIGSGKSTISKYLKDKGIPVIDADLIAREVIVLYKEILEKIKLEFGEKYIDENGNLRRRELGNLIFGNEELKIKLENIFIPFIKKEIFNRIEIYEKHGEKLCIVDAPTLIENNIHKNMDVNILVWVDYETQIKRVAMRDELLREQVIKRINAQMPLEDKKKYVDYIIDNSFDIEKTLNRVDYVIEDIRSIKINN